MFFKRFVTAAIIGLSLTGISVVFAQSDLTPASASYSQNCPHYSKRRTATLGRHKDTCDKCGYEKTHTFALLHTCGIPYYSSVSLYR